MDAQQIPVALIVIADLAIGHFKCGSLCAVLPVTLTADPRKATDPVVAIPGRKDMVKINALSEVLDPIQPTWQVLAFPPAYS